MRADNRENNRMKKKAIFQALWFDVNVLILDKNFNKNFRLRLERLYGCTVLNNHDFRKKATS